MHGGAAALDGGDDLEAGVAADLAHGLDGSVGLVEEDVPGRGGGGGAHEDALLALHQGLGEARRVAHHAVDQAVEQQFHLAGDVAPVAGGAEDDGVRVLQQLQHALRVVFDEHARALGAAGHAADAGFDLQVVGIDGFNLVAFLLRFFPHDAEHLRDVTLLARASVDDQNIHSFVFIFIP